MTSTFPSLSRFLYSAGVFGLLTSHGSMTITLPLGVVIFVVACPSQWISVFALWAHVGSAASVSVAAALVLRNSRRSMRRPPVIGAYSTTEDGARCQPSGFLPPSARRWRPGCWKEPREGGAKPPRPRHCDRGRNPREPLAARPGRRGE